MAKRSAPRQSLPFGDTSALSREQKQRAQILDQATRRSRTDATPEQVMERARWIAGEE